MLERLRFQVAFARSGLTALALLNGGGLLFALVGGAGVAIGAAFLLGAVAVILSCLAGFLSQGAYYALTVLGVEAMSYLARGRRAEAAGLGLAVASLLFFVTGAAIALSAGLPA